MSLLGDDGVGYDLAKKLDSNGAWRSWLGDSCYSQIIPYLNSLAAWKNFMSTDGNKSKSQIQLQLRVRALLFDKASASLYLRSSTSSSLSPASVQSSYLQLRADDVYYSFEEDVDDWNRLQAEGSLTAKPFQIKDIEGTSCAGSRFAVNDVESLSRSKPGEILDTWYSQWREKHLQERMHWLAWRSAQRDLPFKDRDTFKRTPERMSAYLRASEKHRNKIRVTQLDKVLHFPNSARDNVSGVKVESSAENACSMDEEPCFFPESMFPSNCVPDNSVPRSDKEDENSSLVLPGILDNLPYETGRSPLLIERFGMGSDYLNLGIKKVDSMGKNREAVKRKRFGEEEVEHRARQTIVRVCAGVGFEGLKEGSLDVFSQLLISHICKHGQILRVLVDNFRNRYTPIDLLRMFIQKMEYSNLGTLMDYVKAPTRSSPQQTPQQLVRATPPQPQMILPHSQQKLQRHLSQQMNVFQHQSMSSQMQQQLVRRKQPSTPRSGRKVEKDRTMCDTRIETSNDSAVASALVSHWQQQQQPQSSQGSHHPQSLTQFKQHSSLQLPQIHQQNFISRDAVQIRTQPMKVEGFQELMGGDVNVKQEPEDDIGRTLISPRGS